MKNEVKKTQVYSDSNLETASAEDLEEMEKERVNLIIRNLELLLDSLKAEVNSDRDDKVDYNPYSEYIEDYDEVFEEEND